MTNPIESFYRNSIEKQQKYLRETHAEIAKAAESVLQIAQYNNSEITGIGTGVVFDSLHILTAAHVVLDADEFAVYMNAKGLRLSTLLSSGDIIIDRALDIALMPLPEVFQDMIPSLSSDSKTYDDEAFLIGFPQLNESISWEPHRPPTIHKLCLDDNARDNDELTAIVIDKYFVIPHGASGGPIIDSEGKLLGIAIKGSCPRIVAGMPPTIRAIPIPRIQSVFAAEL